MSSATLLGGALKPRQTGAQAVESIPPEKLLPGKATLNQLLIDYQKAGTDLDESRGHLARAETDEQSALNNLELSDEESANRVAVSQRSRGIYGARVANRETAQAKLLKELKSALYAGHDEFSALHGALLTKWREILVSRVMEAGQLGKDVATEIEILLENARPIVELRRLEISSVSITYVDSAEQITGMARRILDGYEAIAAKMKEQI